MRARRRDASTKIGEHGGALSAAPEPVIRWTPEEVWVMAGAAWRMLIATIDGVEHHATATHGAVFRVHEQAAPTADGIELVLAIAADVATLSLAARDPGGHRWRDGWALEIVRGDEPQLLEPGGAIEIRGGELVAKLRMRRRAVVGEHGEHVALVDAGCHRYTRQSSIVDAQPTAVVPWMTPTCAEPAPWWEIDLGKAMSIVWMRIDLGVVPAGSRVTCHAFGYPAPSGAPPAGSIVTEIAAGDLHVVDDQAWFTVDAPVVARYVRVCVTAPAGEAVTLTILATEIQAAELFGTTLAETLRRAFVLHADRTLCLVRSVDGSSYDGGERYSDLWQRASALSRGLAARLEPSADRIVVAVMLRNRAEWIVTDLAILERGYVSVSLAPDDSDERLAQILALAKPTCIVVEASNAERVARLGARSLRLVVVLDGEPTAADHVAFDRCTAEAAPPPAPRSEDDVYAILFTSGSTGTPKGAMRTYRTFHAMIASYAIGHSPRHLSFQPLSHLSERMYLPAVLVFGGSIAFSRGGAHLVDELAALRPTTVGSVPRLFEVLHAGYARRLRAAIAADPHAPRDALETRLLAETRAQLGDRLLAVSVGSAPCSAEVLAFLRRCFADVWVTEGYGTTELGTISVDGRISDHVAVKLVPDGRGEIWVKTPHVIAGYLGESTPTIDDDGFVATGDLGERDADGRVRIVGRVRNTIKLAQGEFVSIDRIEAILATAPTVDQIFIYPARDHAHLACVVVPRGEQPDATTIAAELRAHGRTAGLLPYEIPTDVVVEREPFSVENGLLTASGKLARPALAARYAAATPPPDVRTEVDHAGGDLATRIAQLASRIAKRAIAVDEPLGAGIGVDSLAAAEILAALSEELHRDVPLQWWFEARTFADLAARLTAPAHAGAAANDAANVSLARADLALEVPVVARSIPRAEAHAGVRRVLLTGATGFLGSFLVEALRARGIAVTCLVRARDDAAAMQRLVDALARREIEGVARDGVQAIAGAASDGVRAIAGDLASLDLEAGTVVDRGVDAGAFDDVDAVVHAGATVSWLASYEALRAPNVLGTVALLRLAARRGIPFHHVSTISTAPPDGDETSRLAFEHVVGSTPYALSKWIAEDHVRRAGEAGLPVAIYRPAMIAADTRRGVGNPEDFLNRYLVGCAELGLYIDREDAVIDMTPVDFVAAAIAACVARGPALPVLQLANVEQSLTYAALGRALVAAGVRVAPATYEAFRAALLANRTSRLHPLAAFFPERFSLGMGPWPCAKSVAALAELGVTRPRIDAALIARHVDALRRRGAAL